MSEYTIRQAIARSWRDLDGSRDRDLEILYVQTLHTSEFALLGGFNYQVQI